ncbi:hypothetical protein B0H19DRAFT_1262610 [Mycena capillaripes]|nr:hypothetical protein B0H19DRAFT_1262610 [Mycena capillaripes]
MCGQSSPPKNAKSTVQCPKAEDVTVWLRWVVSPVSAARVLVLFCGHRCPPSAGSTRNISGAITRILRFESFADEMRRYDAFVALFALTLTLIPTQVEDRSRSIVLPGSDFLALPLSMPMLGQRAPSLCFLGLSLNLSHIARALILISACVLALFLGRIPSHTLAAQPSAPSFVIVSCDEDVSPLAVAACRGLHLAGCASLIASRTPHVARLLIAPPSRPGLPQRGVSAGLCAASSSSLLCVVRGLPIVCELIPVHEAVRPHPACARGCDAEDASAASSSLHRVVWLLWLHIVLCLGLVPTQPVDGTTRIARRAPSLPPSDGRARSLPRLMLMVPMLGRMDYRVRVPV